MLNIFKGYQFALELGYSFQYKQKQELKKKITKNGGIISYAINDETNFLIVSNIKKAESTYNGRTAQKNGTPIVTIDFINHCIKEHRLVDHTKFLATGVEFGEGKIKDKTSSKTLSAVQNSKFNFESICVWKWGDNKAPEFDEEHYEVAKSCLLLSSSTTDMFCQLELHVVPPVSSTDLNEENKYYFRVFCHHGNYKKIKDESGGTKECRYLLSSSDSLKTYAHLYNMYTSQSRNYKKTNKFISRWIGSGKQRQISLANSFDSGTLSTKVAELVEHIWQEANEELHGVLALPENKVTKKQVEKAEGTLLQIRHILDTDGSVTELDKLSKKFFEIIPLQKSSSRTIRDKQMLSKVQDICQLLKDIANVSEATDFSARSSIESKYRALQCHIEQLSNISPEYKKISELVKSSNERKNKFEIRNIFAINRAIEESNFSHHIGNKKLLFHASKPANFVGIFTRGLLLPKIVVDDFGGKRTDPGNLGSGIYFTDSSSTSTKYSSRSKVKGTRFMLVNEVALGKCLDMKSKDYKLSAAPEGYNSVHGVKRVIGKRSDFTDDEFVVYNTNQQRIRYLVEFVLPEDSIKDIIQQSLKVTENGDNVPDVPMTDISIDDIKSIANPLDKVQAGLQSKDNSIVPLTAVHIRAKLIDLAAQVVVLQAYRNDSTNPIEAKYVFPLDDMAAVCGFETFINGKHIIGEVKEKEVAHKEYKEAISKGHGAYLMDEEAPDVFTVSVGNLPPESEVLIKITYVAELAVESGKIVFNLPGSVAPWKKDSALSVTTQEQMGTVNCGNPSAGETSLQIAVEMPYDIISIKSPTHLINLKQSTTKATVKLNKNVGIGKGFQLLIQLAEIHVPRMWVEKHQEKLDKQACMLSFYPEFESKETASPEILFVLDLSNSMKGDNLLQAKKILLMSLHHLPPQATFNIITFGTNYDEVFPICQPANSHNTLIAKKFIRNVQANMGNTEVWRPLHSYFLLSDASRLRNVFLISDGHINNEESTLAAVRLNARNNRVFTFGVSATANKHLLRALARVGTGAFEFFDTSTKSKWEKKVKGQLLKARQPALSNVSIEWYQSDDNAAKPIQAPSQITSLFSGSRQVVYGYVPSCRQATLKAYINGDEISTTVSTNEFSVTRGKILHQLTARAIIRDWEDGTLDADPVQHDIKKDAQKSYIIELSKEYSIVTQFTSFVAIEEREKTDFVGTIFKPSISDLVAKEDVDDLPYANWEGSGVTESPKVARSGLDVLPIDPPASCFPGADLDEALRDCHYLMATEPMKKKKNFKRGAKKKTSVMNNIEEVQDIMQQNIDYVLERDAKLSDLDERGMDFGSSFKSRKQVHKRRKEVQTCGYVGETIPTIGFSENVVKKLTARRAAAKQSQQSRSKTETIGEVGKNRIKLGFSESTVNKIINNRTYVNNCSSDSDDEDLCGGMNFNAYDPTIEDSYAAYGDFNAYEPTIEDSYGGETLICHALMDFDKGESLERAGLVDLYRGEHLKCYGLMDYDEARPRYLSRKFGFPKFRMPKVKGRKAMVLESCARPNYARYRPYLSNTVEETTPDIKKYDEIDFGLLSFYQREKAEVTCDESDALYKALRRVFTRQIHNGSWVIKCLRELLKLEDIIREHAQKLATENVAGSASDYEAILSTAVVICLLEYALMNWAFLYKDGTCQWDEHFYSDVFVSLGIGESFIREVRFSKRKERPRKGISWVDYAEKNLLHVIPQTGLNVQSLVFVGADGFVFPRKQEFWLEEQPWKDRSFWTLSPTHAVLFNYKRHYVIFLLEKSGKSLDLGLQKKAECMLAMAIGIVRIEPAVKSSVNRRNKSRSYKTDYKLTDGLEQLNIWLNEMEEEHYGLAPHLELGKDWRDVASKLINSSLDSAY